MSVDGGLEALDKSCADIDALIHHAANILRVDLRKIELESAGSDESNASASNTSFKEQWVLRWLTRKVQAEVQVLAKKGADAPSPTFLTNLHFWSLLLNVLCSIPDQTCAEILVERKFVQCLDQAIQWLLHQSGAGCRTSNERNVETPSQVSEDGRSIKRRRLSPVPQAGTNKSSTIERFDDHFRLLLQLCGRIARIFGRSPGSSTEEVFTATTSWCSSAKDNASMLSTALRVVSALCAQLASESTAKALSWVVQLISFWHSRPVAITDSARAEEVSLFFARCLDPCLHILDFVHHLEPGVRPTHVKEDLEKLIALNVVLPLRKHFFQRHAKSWKSQTRCITWREILRVYNGFNRVIDPSFTSLPDEINMKAVTWAEHVALIYGVAVRILPKSALQRRQQEQPWLDALLAFLSYVSCPRLAKLEIARDDSVEFLELAYPSALTDEPPALLSLFKKATELASRPSLQVLGYLTFVIISWGGLDQPWPFLAQLVELDADVLVSNSGLVTSTLALEALMQNVESTMISQQDYACLRDRILIPLLEGYARSRALKDFLQRWVNHLEEALRKSIAGSPRQGKLPAVLVWQDEDLLESLSRLYPLHETMILTQSLLAQLRDKVGALVERKGSSLDVFAHAAIMTAVIDTGTLTNTESDMKSLHEIGSAAATALCKHSDYQGQRWRLWKLIRVIQLNSSEFAVTKMLLDAKGLHEVTLPALTKSLFVQGHDPVSIPRYRECLERFILIAQKAAGGISAYAQAFIVELNALHTLITSKGSDVNHRLPQLLWNGRTADLDDPQKLVYACIGAVVAHPKLLKASPDFVLSVRQMKGVGVQGSNAIQLLASTLTEVDCLNCSQDGMVEPWVTTKGDDVLTISDLERLWQDMSADRYKRVQVKALGDRMFEMIREPAQRPSIGGLVYLLAAMDKLSEGHSTPFTRAEAWDSWIQLLREMEDSYPIPQKQHLAAVSDAMRILTRVWTRIEQAGKVQQTIDALIVHQKDVAQSLSISSALTRRLAFDVAATALAASDVESDSSRRFIQQCLSDATKSFESLVSAVEEPITESMLVAAIVSLERLLKSCHDPTVKDNAVLRKTATNLRGKLQVYNCTDEALAIFNTAQSQCDRLCSALSIKNHYSKPLNETIRSLLSSSHLDSNQNLNRLTIKAQSIVAGLDSDGMVDLLALIHNEDFSAKIGLLQPIFVGLVVTKVSVMSSAPSKTLIDSLDRLANLSSTIFVHTKGQLALAIENSKLVLEQNSDLVKQNTIDVLLSNICRVMSSGNQMSEDLRPLVPPEVIFDRVCSLLGTLLSRFRRRIADRHHLLLAVMQNLLKCFFFPGRLALTSRHHSASSFSTAFFQTLPAWLKSSDKPLPPSSATKFSRLLSTICNPTVSAAKSSRRKNNHNDLNDETKRVKAIAGQHMQYLIMEYARCSLDGEIKSEVKEKLMPGMYTVLDAMGRDVMRGMNAAMDPSSRAIFKGLYDDWVRYGKWSGS